MGGETFSKKDSLAIKGIAILMMLWHHCFLSGRFESFTISFWPLRQSQVEHIASFFKICVSLFAFISGYGLWFSYQKARKEHQNVSEWTSKRLVSTLSNYWFVVLLAWVVCMAINRLPYHVYGFETSFYLGVWNMFIEFLGLSNLADGTLMNTTWWYMSAAVAFIVLLPVINMLFERIGVFCTIAAIFIFPRICGGYPGGTKFLSFLPAFCFGIVFAKLELFAVWKRIWAWAEHSWFRIVKYGILLLMLGFCYKLYYFLSTNLWWDVKWGLIPVLVLLISLEFLRIIPPVKSIFTFLGKHATNIFLVHTFIRNNYCHTFIYTRGNVIAIVACLLLISLIISIVIEALKKILKWESLIGNLLTIPDKVRAKN